MLLFDAGDDAEATLIQRLTDVGYDIIKRGPNNQQFTVTGESPDRAGHLDGFINFEGAWFPFDIKTSGSFGFKEWVGYAGFMPGEIKARGFQAYDPREVPNSNYQPVEEHSPTYYYQAQGYMELVLSNKKELEQIARFGGKPIGEGFYFFVQNKDNSAMYQEYVPFNKEKIKARLLTLDKGLGIIKTDAGKLRKPTKKLANTIRKEREHSVSTKLPWQCKFCPHLRICWGKEKPGLVNAELGEEKLDSKRNPE